MSTNGTRILIYGNSGSGKTTMAARLAKRRGLGWLSLDDIAWKREVSPPERQGREVYEEKMRAFMETHEDWVMDGCYGNLIRFAVPFSTELRFLNPGVEACLNNCRQRAWEPDKFPSKEAQDAMLKGLLEWVKAYADRDDDCSLTYHRILYDRYQGSRKDYRNLTESVELL